MIPPAEEVASVVIVNTCFGMTLETDPCAMNDLPRTESARGHRLSARAVNVLKLLAAEMTGESPARKNWLPSNAFLQKLKVEHLLTARNCGPRTVNEIIQWARSRGVTITPLFHIGKSLSETWRVLNARFAAGELTKAEVAEALERSVRRRSARIPVPIQRILLELFRANVLGAIRPDPGRPVLSALRRSTDIVRRSMATVHA
jgi:hypothetical protein